MIQKNKLIERMIQLHLKGKDLMFIGKKFKYSRSYIWKLIHTHPKYTSPTKKGFARLSKEELQKITSRGGKKSFSSGNGHRWNSKEARKASLKNWKNQRSLGK